MSSACHLNVMSADFLPSPLVEHRGKSEALLRPPERPEAVRPQGRGAERAPGERGRGPGALNAAASGGASLSPQPFPARGAGNTPDPLPHPEAGDPCFQPLHHVFPNPAPLASPRRCGCP